MPLRKKALREGCWSAIFMAISGQVPFQLRNSPGQQLHQIGNLNAFLLHGIPVAQCDCVLELPIFLAECFEIDRHAERRSNFVLATITPSDGAAFIVEDIHVRPQKIDNLFCFRHQLFLVFQKRKHRTFDRRHTRMKTQDGARLHFSFFVRRFIFRVRFANQGKESAIHTGAWLDYVRNKFLLCLFIKILQRFPARLLVLR